MIPFHKDSRFIVPSDCHRGDGSAGDEFARNSLIYKCALEYYLEHGFTYIELGDAEELWENDAFAQIYITHTSFPCKQTRDNNQELSPLFTQINLH